MKAKRLFMLLGVVLLAAIGCSPKMKEEMRRGTPGTEGYIAPDYRPCRIIAFEPEYVKQLENGTALRQAYTVIEDDRGRRYRKTGKVGEVGDEFQMDVSLTSEVK